RGAAPALDAQDERQGSIAEGVKGARRPQNPLYNSPIPLPIQRLKSVPTLLHAEHGGSLWERAPASIPRFARVPRPLSARPDDGQGRWVRLFKPHRPGPLLLNEKGEAFTSVF